MRTFLRPVFMSAAVLFVCALASNLHGALITFSELTNLTTDLTSPPAGYQPLENAYPTPGSNVDGANIGVGLTITGLLTNFSNTAPALEHTQSVTPSDTAYADLFLLAANGGTVTFTFTSPVDVPSLFYAFNTLSMDSPVGPTTFNGYTHSGDMTPAISDTLSTHSASRWDEVTGLGTTPIEQLTIVTSGQYLQLDDFTVNAVPEPATLSLVMVGGLILLGRFGWQRAAGTAIAQPDLNVRQDRRREPRYRFEFAGEKFECVTANTAKPHARHKRRVPGHPFLLGWEDSCRLSLISGGLPCAPSTAPDDGPA